MASLPKILIIDDNPKILQDALPMYGYEVNVALDGVQALVLLGQIDSFYDLILLDVMMPNMDGWETIKAIRTNPRTQHIPIIMVSAVTDQTKQVSALKFGADDYITKPYILPNVLARIDALLRRTNWQKNKKSQINTSFEISSDIEPLTIRQKEILRMIAQGLSNKQIADKLFVRDVTIKTHINTIFKKLKVQNRTQAVLLAIQTKIIDE